MQTRRLALWAAIVGLVLPLALWPFTAVGDEWFPLFDTSPPRAFGEWEKRPVRYVVFCGRQVCGYLTVVLAGAVAGLIGICTYCFADDRADLD